MTGTPRIRLGGLLARRDRSVPSLPARHTPVLRSYAEGVLGGLAAARRLPGASGGRRVGVGAGGPPSPAALPAAPCGRGVRAPHHGAKDVRHPVVLPVSGA